MDEQEFGIKTGKLVRPHESDDDNINNCDNLQERLVKAKRYDIELPAVAEVDLKLAEKLDNLLKLGSDTQAQKAAKPKFFLNKLRPNTQGDQDQISDIDVSKEKILPLLSAEESSKLKARNLSKDELKDRLLKNHETLVPELDPNRPKDIKVVKILTAKESIELAKDQAHKQLERTMELSSIHGNQQAHILGLGGFKFLDGYETLERKFPLKRYSHAGGTSKQEEPPIEVISRQTQATRSILQLRNQRLDTPAGQLSTNKKSVTFSPVAELTGWHRYVNEFESNFGKEKKPFYTYNDLNEFCDEDEDDDSYEYDDDDDEDEEDEYDHADNNQSRENDTDSIAPDKD